ncbi:hypothetical protein TNCV_1202011 [Trichonephila clavipes]|nr:hypothetical protein TNCV_1202011 [Trichonephila clavipes]
MEPINISFTYMTASLSNQSKPLSVFAEFNPFVLVHKFSANTAPSSHVFQCLFSQPYPSVEDALPIDIPGAILRITSRICGLVA